MTIRNIDHFVGALWDWAILDGCFGKTRIRPSDIDGYVERNGNFLVIEAKSHNKSLDAGQRISFTNMIKTGRFVVLIVWGETNKPEKMQIFPDEIKKATLADLRRMVSWWYKNADKGENPAFLLAGRRRKIGESIL